jgi:ubiquinone/menaquinone biosynthesis C-methylase UbiE
VTAADIVLDPQFVADYPHIRCQEAAVERLPFPDRAFDTVVCAHTLEHVQELEAAIRELRRVTARRLIIVVPRQRPYQYTFDLHLHFFPYRSSLLMALKPGKGNYHCENLQGDWFYFEDH